MDSGEASGWIPIDGENRLLRIIPQTKEESPSGKKINAIYALFAGKPLDDNDSIKISNYNSNEMTYKDKVNIEIKKIRSIDESSSYQPRWIWQSKNAAKEHNLKYWKNLIINIRQPHDDMFVQNVFTELLLERIQYLDFDREEISIESEERSLVQLNKAKQPIPCVRIYVTINVPNVLEIDEVRYTQIAGILWRAIDRFHAYLAERFPPNIGLYIQLCHLNKTQILHTWKTDNEGE